MFGISVCSMTMYPALCRGSKKQNKKGMDMGWQSESVRLDPNNHFPPHARTRQGPSRRLGFSCVFPDMQKKKEQVEYRIRLFI
ncbi:hypothetical protein J2Z65_002848 [Paenibacillus aceris]|uniref:Uncharacterized protein n=1 Tax=Paenibacillus aceris TaxID=869555 RepID=A0ABS4HYA1_9BACL|nr:hypothetical protein [Paenibacillus aceris]